MFHPIPQDNMDEMPGALLLVGNKTDLSEAGSGYQREVSRETGETFAKVLKKQGQNKRT